MQLHKVVPVGSWKHDKGLELFSAFCGYFRYLNTLSQFAPSSILIGPLVKPVGQWGGAQEYSLTCQMVIG